jgi:hypothetical protein
VVEAAICDNMRGLIAYSITPVSHSVCLLVSSTGGRPAMLLIKSLSVGVRARENG